MIRKKSVVIYGNEKLNPNNIQNGSNNSIVELQNGQKDVKVFYGIGNWNKNQIKYLSNNIDSIVFYENDEKFIITEEQKIRNFLK